MSDRPLVPVATREALEALVAVLSEVTRVGVDTEANSFHAYHERVCLIQISTEEADYVVDPLAVDPAPLAALFADPAIEVIFHAAEYDVRSMKRDFGFTFARLFDTQVAAMLLGSGQVGYAALVERYFDLHLPKAHQRSDWGRRPLSPSQVEYAAADARWLIPLRDLLAAELEARGRRVEAEDHFARMSALEPLERTFDPEAFHRIKGYRELDDAGRAVLRELFLAREARSDRLDVPPFKVLNNEAMVAIARQRPENLQALRTIRGISQPAIHRWGDELLAAVRRGLASPTPPPRHQRRAGVVDPAVQVRYERLRLWRRDKAAERGIPVQLIARGSTLKAVALANPPDLESLAAIPGVDAAVLEAHGPEMLAVLRGN